MHDLDIVEPLIDLGELPFYVGEQMQPTNVDLPDILPFSVGFRPTLHLVVQIPNKTVGRYLERAYYQGSVVGSPMSEEGIGRRYADDFLGFIETALPREPKESGHIRALEIGCGTGYL